MQLHPYQEQAVEFLRRTGSAGLFLDMGLGKTATVLRALEPRHLPALVIAPKRVAEQVWPVEAELWRPDLTIAIAAGTPEQRDAALASGADVVVLSRDNLWVRKRGESKRLAVSLRHPFQTVVLDELSSFKNASTQRFQAAHRICKDRIVWGLTGTPSPNGLLDLWSQAFLLDRGARLGQRLTHYRARYFDPGRQMPTPRGMVTVSWDLKPGADKAIHRKLSDLCLSMSAIGRVNLPPLTVNQVSVPLPPTAERVYQGLKGELVTDLGDDTITAASAAVAMGKLAQITAGFLYRNEEDGGGAVRLHTAKLDALEEVIESAQGSPVLVFHRFKEELSMLRERFAVNTPDEPNFMERWNAGQIPILAAHPASAGHGLNFQHGGHTIVWTTTTWSLEEHQQANARLLRQGQKHPVVIHYLVSPGTVDEAILARLKNKTSVQDALLTHLRKGN